MALAKASREECVVESPEQPLPSSSFCGQRRLASTRMEIGINRRVAAGSQGIVFEDDLQVTVKVLLKVHHNA